MWFWETGFGRARWELLKRELKIDFSSNHFVKFSMLVLERTVRTAPPLSGLIASVEPARSPVAAGCLSTPAGCPRPSWASGAIFLLGTLLGLPQWSEVGKIKHLLSAHIFPRPNSQNLSGVLFRKEFSSLKCWEIYKIKTLNLKISFRRWG